MPAVFLSRISQTPSSRAQWRASQPRHSARLFGYTEFGGGVTQKT